MSAKSNGIVGYRGSVGRWQTFWNSIEKTESCWLWRGLVSTSGYGTLVMYGKSRKAHRLMMLWTGRIESVEHTGSMGDGLILHSCDNRLCVNPAHLSVGGAGRNLAEAYERGQKKPMPGISNPRAKLAEATVCSIRSDYACGMTHEQLAAKYNVCQRTINKVVRRISYKDIV